jgi:ATP-binding cassette subfamily F protein uup
VTHDRYLLDRVTNVVLGLDGRGNAVLFADYIQWEEWRAEFNISLEGLAADPRPEAPHRVVPPQVGSTRKKKLSYIEQREYDAIEARIQDADRRLFQARSHVEDPALTTNAAALTEALAALDAAQTEHNAVYERWVELTEKADE